MEIFARVRARIDRIPQLWRFALYAGGSFAVLLLATRGDMRRAAAFALLWAILMTLWDALRLRRLGSS